MFTYLSKPSVVSLDDIHCLCHQIISKEPEVNVIDFMTDYKKKYTLNVKTEYGYDIPVSEEQSKNGLRGYEYLLVLPKEDYMTFTGPTVTKKIIPKSKYLTLLISDPFADPFERIPNAWKTLIDSLEANYKFNVNPLMACLEENLQEGEVINMRIYAPIIS